MSEAPEQTWPIGFYAPGDYWGTCVICGKQHLADKRAVNCADCTLQACYRELEKLRAQPAIDLDAIRREARNEALREAAACCDAEADRCDDAAKWGGSKRYVSDCKAAAYAMRDRSRAITAMIEDKP